VELQDRETRAQKPQSNTKDETNPEKRCGM
jgi:hypothetical protein